MGRNGTLAPEEARALLEQERQSRARRCLEKIQEVLNEERCRMEVYVILRPGTIEPRVEIVPID